MSNVSDGVVLRPWLLSVVLAAVAVSGCSSDPLPAEVKRSEREFPTSYAQLEELRSQFGTPDDELNRAVQQAIQTCMQEQGFEYQIWLPDDSSKPSDTPILDSFESALQPETDPDPNVAYLQSLAQSAPSTAREWIRALQGDGPVEASDAASGGVSKGCENTAADRAFGDGFQQWTAQIVVLAEQLASARSADRAVVAAKSVFDVCLAGPEPTRLRNEFDDAYGRLQQVQRYTSEVAAEIDRLRPLERSLADSEARCRLDSGLSKAETDASERLFGEIAEQWLGS